MGNINHHQGKRYNTTAGWMTGIEGYVQQQADEIYRWPYYFAPGVDPLPAPHAAAGTEARFRALLTQILESIDGQPWPHDGWTLVLRGESVSVSPRHHCLGSKGDAVLDRVDDAKWIVAFWLRAGSQESPSPRRSLAGTEAAP